MGRSVNPGIERRFRKRQEQKRKAIAGNRTCGECQACCEVLGVKELEKPHLTPCKHQCPTGCAIYSLRPKTCQIYECLWLSGNLKDEDVRPDLIGIIFDAPSEVSRIENMVVAREVWEGAFESEIGLNLTQAVSQQFPVYMMHRNGKRTILTADPAIAAKAQQIAEEILARK